MKTVDIRYNPYKLQTTVLVDGVDILQRMEYEKWKPFIQQHTPLQNWIDPISYLNWKGFVNELSPEEVNDKVHLRFEGRKIDFEDLRRSIELQNNARSERTRVAYTFEHTHVLDDKELSDNIDQVVQELQTDTFAALVKSRTGESLSERYRNLQASYTRAKETEFYIAFAGVYSSGKSTLINTLIRHNVLPSSIRCCTPKNCRIRHNKSLGKKIALTCYDKSNQPLMQTQIFEDDGACTKAFLELCPVGGEQMDERIETMEIGVDLSHLYPDGVSDDKFTIVLIDTPGMDSAHSNDPKTKSHAQISMEAITMASKPMVVLCVDANKYVDQSIGDFMHKIVSQATEDNGGFNDRFLFIMNKSDQLPYKVDEHALSYKQEFISYLTDSTRWNIEADEESLQILADNAARFVPRVFMTSAAMANAIQSGLHEATREELAQNPEQRKLSRYLSIFMDDICALSDENFFLSRYGDNPSSRIEELNQAFEAALESEDEAQATLLQSGILNIEFAIKDYIARYAYPLKVRSLLETFEAILNDVEAFTASILEEMKTARELIGDFNEDREEAKEQKKKTKQKIHLLNVKKDEIDKQIKALNQIQFDETRLKKAIGEFRADIDADKTVRFVRLHDKVSTGQKTGKEVQQEIEELTGKLTDVFNKALDNSAKVMQEIMADQEALIASIYQILSDIVLSLEQSDILSAGNFSFKNSFFWNTDIKKVAPDIFRDSLSGEVVAKTKKKQEVLNMHRIEYLVSKSKLKHWVAEWFMPQFKQVYVPVDGYYSTEQLQRQISLNMLRMDEACQDLKTQFKKEIAEGKKTVSEVTSSLLSELQAFLDDVLKRENLISRLSSDIAELDNEIARLTDTMRWLNGLKKKIKGE